MAQCTGQRGVRPAIGRYRENAATGNRAPDAEKVGLEGAEKRYIWQLSGGQRQRVGIARALAANPQLLLLDEPFGALDAFTRDQMQTLLLKLWQETGKQVLLITHDIEEAVFMATELVLLSSGHGRVLEAAAAQLCSPLCCGRVEPQHQVRSTIHRHARICFKPRI